MSQQQWSNAPAGQWSSAPWPHQQSHWAPPQGQPPPGRPPIPWQQPPKPKRRSGFVTLLQVIVTIGIIMAIASTIKNLMTPVQPAPPLPSDRTVPTQPYENEQYTPPSIDRDPPPLVVPTTVSEAERLMLANRLYDQSVTRPTQCPMTPIDMATATQSEMESHFNELMGCLMAVFEQPVTAAGYVMPRPAVQVYNRPINTACGVMDELNAAYCTGDQRVYYAAPLLRAFPTAVGETRYAAETVLAHEFGHAVQARTGILVSELVMEDRARSEASAQEWSRRLEVQADCLAGLYVGAVAESQALSDADVANLVQLTYNIGDDVLTDDPGFVAAHGSGQARSTWFSRGTGTNVISVCNTFTAPTDEVR